MSLVIQRCFAAQQYRSDGNCKECLKTIDISSLGKVSKKSFFLWKVFPNVGGLGGLFPNKIQIPQKKQNKSPDQVDGEPVATAVQA